MALITSRNAAERPRLELAYTPLQKGLEIFCAAAILGLFFYIASQYGSLPDQVPLHFSLSGDADTMGDRSTIWLLFGIAAFIYLLMTGIGRVPRFYNYPAAVTEENAPRLYQAGRTFLAILKLEVVVLFAAIAWQVIGYGTESVWRQAYMLPLFVVIFTSLLGSMILTRIARPRSS